MPEEFDIYCFVVVVIFVVVLVSFKTSTKRYSCVSCEEAVRERELKDISLHSPRRHVVDLNLGWRVTAG